MIQTAFDGTVTLIDPADAGRTLVIPAGSPDRDAQIIAFFGPPPRTLVRKSTVIRRLHDAGKLAAVMGVLDAPANVYAKARWWSPDWPEIYTDDPEAVAIVSAVGGDAAVILAPEEGA